MVEPIAITHASALTALGSGKELFQKLLLGTNAFTNVTPPVAHIKVENISQSETISQEILKLLTLPKSSPNSRVMGFLATTVGAIDAFRKSEEEEKPIQPLNNLEYLSTLCTQHFGINWNIVSAACASGSAAISLACQALRCDFCDEAYILGFDLADEFVISGFSALGAISPTGATPYDQNHNGLTPGDGAALMVLSKEKSANTLGYIIDCIGSCDMYNIVAPDPDGVILSNSIIKLLQRIGNPDIGAIIGHGTGTKLNDEAELKALKKVFGNNPPPLWSPKGNFGHTFGASGVIQGVLALEILKNGILPGQAGLKNPHPMAKDMVSSTPRKISSKSTILSLNSGFGGINQIVAIRL